VRIAVLSDVHGNLSALEAVLGAVGGDVDETWCLGDVVGYGPRPNECAALTRERCQLVLAGNHDLAVVGRVDTGHFSTDAARALRWTREVMRPDVADWLGSLEPVGERGSIGLFHGSPRDPIWEYVLDPAGAREALAATAHATVLVGHTHAAIAARLMGDRLAGGRANGGTGLDLGGGRRSLLNPGSVGQPRDADPRAAWLELDLDDDGDAVRARFRRIRYDVGRTQREIVAAGLPQHLADRLSFGM